MRQFILNKKNNPVFLIILFLFAFLSCKKQIEESKILFYSADPKFVDIYDVPAQTWSACSIPQDFTSIISTGDKVYLAGGLLNGVISKQVWLLDF